jgi:hypothetical protein
MKRRRVFFHVAIAVAIFGLIMQAAHIGSIDLWITVSGVAFAVGIIRPSDAERCGTAVTPLAEPSTSFVASSDALSSSVLRPYAL